MAWWCQPAAAWAAALVLAAPLALSLPVHAQSRGDILEPPTRQRPPARRAAPPTELRPTLDGREQADPTEAVRRQAARDGDLTEPEPPQPRDGIIEELEPEQPDPAGLDTTRFDGRPQSDFAAFEVPPAGHDPQLFQVEEIEPREDRRVGAFFVAEPYAQIGYRIGRFVVFPQVELAGVAFSNVLKSPVAAKSDLAFDVRPELRVVSNWRRHAMELKANGVLDFHEQVPSEDQRQTLLEARGRLDVSRHTNVQGLISHEVSQESRSGIDANRLGDRADITTKQAAGSVNHRLNRLYLQLRGAVTETTYGSIEDEVGQTIERRDRNQVQTEQGVRVRYDRRSQVGVFADVGLVQREYGASPDDGLKRDSMGERYRVGLAFLPAHPRLRGEVSLGLGTHRHEERALASVDGLLFDANLVWRMTPLTSLLLTAKSDIADSVTQGVNGVVTRSWGLELRQGLRRWLTATAGFQVNRSDYRGIALDETDRRLRLGLEYALSRQIQLFSRYEHTWFDTSDPSGNWEADELRIGMRLRN